MIRDVLRMGDPRLLRRAQPVEAFGTPALAALLDDMRDTVMVKVLELMQGLPISLARTV